VEVAVFYTTISTALFYLMSRAKLTQFAWSRYPTWLDYWLSCAACSGFWFGVGIAVLIGRTQEVGVFGLDPLAWYTPLVAGATEMVWTPILARLMIVSWMDLLVEPDDTDAIPDAREGESTEPLRIIPLEPPDNGA